MADNIIPFPRKPSNDNSRDLPPQPGLRSFIVYDELPAGCFAIEIEDDENHRHLHLGDFAIIDPTDTDPIDGELYLIERSGGRRQIVEAQSSPFRTPDRFMIAPTTVRAMFTAGGEFGRRLRFMDGPYSREYLQETFLGRVTGIYQPDFQNTLRIAA